MGSTFDELNEVIRKRDGEEEATHCNPMIGSEMRYPHHGADGHHVSRVNDVRDPSHVKSLGQGSGT